MEMEFETWDIIDRSLDGGLFLDCPETLAPQKTRIKSEKKETILQPQETRLPDRDIREAE